MQVKALACELPSSHGVPLARWSRAELARYMQESGLVGTISGSTIWRWLSKDAIRPWQHRSWLFPRDPHFAQKAAPVLDLYQRCWEGQPLRDDELVISADEKTSIQARRRAHASVPARPRRAMRVEHEYQRCGAWAYLAALDVHRAHVVGRCVSGDMLCAVRDYAESVQGSLSVPRPARCGPRLHAFLGGGVVGDILDEIVGVIEHCAFGTLCAQLLHVVVAADVEEDEHLGWRGRVCERPADHVGANCRRFRFDDVHDSAITTAFLCGTILSRLAKPRGDCEAWSSGRNPPTWDNRLVANGIPCPRAST